MIDPKRIESKVIHRLRLSPRKDFNRTEMNGFIADAVEEVRQWCNTLPIPYTFSLTEDQKEVQLTDAPEIDVIVNAEFPSTTLWNEELEWVSFDRLREMQNQTTRCNRVTHWSHWRETSSEDHSEDYMYIGFSDQSAITTGDEIVLYCTLASYDEFVDDAKIPLPRSVELALTYRTLMETALLYAEDKAAAYEKLYEKAKNSWQEQHQITQWKTPFRTEFRPF